MASRVCRPKTWPTSLETRQGLPRFPERGKKRLEKLKTMPPGEKVD